MSKYHESKIYKIINDEMPNMVYYGSTTQKLSYRMTYHRGKYNRCNSLKLFEYGTPKIYLVEKYSCKDIDELRQRERFYIENNECVNKKIPGRNDLEYSRTIDKRRNEKMTCICGSIHSLRNKWAHLKSKKHLNYIN